VNAIPRSIRLGAVVLFAFTLNAAFGSAMEFHGARPNLAVTTLLLCCLYADANLGAQLGFFLGLLEASFAARYVGSFIVTRSLAGFFVGILEERIFRDSPIVALLVVPAGTLFTEGCFFLFAPQPHVLRWLTRTLLQVLYNTALAIPIYLIIRKTARAKKRI
jgi:rod shape-determining protein MreD